MDGGGQSRIVSRREMLRLTLGAAAVAAGSAVLTACGGSATPTPASTSATVAPKPTTVATTAGGVSPTTAAAPAPSAAPSVAATTASGTASSGATASTSSAAAASPAAAVDGKIPSPAEGVPDAYTKLPPKFKSVPNPPGKGGKISVYHITYDPPVPPKDQNKFWQELEKRLNVTWDITLVPASSYQEKTAAVIAGGELPDLMFLDVRGVPDLYKTILQGAFTDLTPYLTGDALKEYPNLAVFPAQLWKNASLNKKIVGVPRPRFQANNGDYFRQDWADKVGMSNPKNADEYFQMLQAFVKNDPDGNGKPDTYGLSTSSPRPSWGIGASSGTIGQMFRIPNEWRLNPDGSLLRFFETEEYKAALAYARKLWEAGVFHPDAANLATTQNKDLFYGSKIGGYNDGLAGLMGSTGARGRTKQFTPTANVTAFIPPGFDGGKPVYQKFIGFFGICSISAKAGKDKEKVKELLRILDYLAAPFGSEERIFCDNGIEGVDYELKDGVPIKNDTGKLEVSALLGMMNNPQVSFYDQPGDAKDMQVIQQKLLANGIDDPTWGYYSQTYAAKQGELAQFEADRRTEIIVGRQPLTAWDQFIKDWKSRGGDQMRKEYEDAIKAAS